MIVQILLYAAARSAAATVLYRAFFAPNDTVPDDGAVVGSIDDWERLTSAPDDAYMVFQNTFPYGIDDADGYSLRLNNVWLKSNLTDELDRYRVLAAIRMCPTDAFPYLNAARMILGQRIGAVRHAWYNVTFEARLDGRAGAYMRGAGSRVLFLPLLDHYASRAHGAWIHWATGIDQSFVTNIERWPHPTTAAFANDDSQFERTCLYYSVSWNDTGCNVRRDPIQSPVLHDEVNKTTAWLRMEYRMWRRVDKDDYALDALDALHNVSLGVRVSYLNGTLISDEQFTINVSHVQPSTLDACFAIGSGINHISIRHLEILVDDTESWPPPARYFTQTNSTFITDTTATLQNGNTSIHGIHTWNHTNAAQESPSPAVIIVFILTWVLFFVAFTAMIRWLRRRSHQRNAHVDCDLQRSPPGGVILAPLESNVYRSRGGSMNQHRNHHRSLTVPASPEYRRMPAVPRYEPCDKVLSVDLLTDSDDSAETTVLDDEPKVTRAANQYDEIGVPFV